MELFTEVVLDVIRSIPVGKVASYGQVARLAGKPRGARQVARILHSMTQKYGLPWYRVVSSQGKIMVPFPEEQAELLQAEGVIIKDGFRIDLRKFQWDMGLD